MTSNIYVAYPRNEEDKVKNVISELNVYLHGMAQIQTTAVSDFDVLSKSDLVLCVLTGNIMDCDAFKDDLKSAFNLNKNIIGVCLDLNLSIKDRLDYNSIKNRIRLGCYEWEQLEDRDRFILQLIAILGLESPLCRPTGIKIALDVVSTDGYYLKIDENAREYSSGRVIIVFVDSSPHKIIVQSKRYPHCRIDEVITPEGLTERLYDLDAVIDERGYEGELNIGGNHYVGWIKHHKPDGHGKYTTVSGEVYNGEFSDGVIISGSLSDSSGNLYYGSFLNWRRNGKGKQIFASGHRYDGDWTDDKFSGQGILLTPSETEYEGKFENHKLVEGKITYPDGSFYVGQSHAWKRHGIGKMTNSDGSVQEGMWSDNVFVGRQP